MAENFTPASVALSKSEQSQRDQTLREVQRSGFQLKDLKDADPNAEITYASGRGKNKRESAISLGDLQALIVDKSIEDAIARKIRQRLEQAAKRRESKKPTEIVNDIDRQEALDEVDATQEEMHESSHSLDDQVEAEIRRVLGDPGELARRKRRETYQKTAGKIVAQKIAASERGVLGYAMKDLYQQSFDGLKNQLTADSRLGSLQGTPREKLKLALEQGLLSPPDEAALRARLSGGLQGFEGNDYVAQYNANLQKEWGAKIATEAPQLAPGSESAKAKDAPLSPEQQKILDQAKRKVEYIAATGRSLYPELDNQISIVRQDPTDVDVANLGVLTAVQGEFNDARLVQLHEAKPVPLPRASELTAEQLAEKIRLESIAISQVKTEITQNIGSLDTQLRDLVEAQRVEDRSLLPSETKARMAVDDLRWQTDIADSGVLDADRSLKHQSEKTGEISTRITNQDREIVASQARLDQMQGQREREMVGKKGILSNIFKPSSRLDQALKIIQLELAGQTRLKRELETQLREAAADAEKAKVILETKKREAETAKRISDQAKRDLEMAKQRKSTARGVQLLKIRMKIVGEKRALANVTRFEQDEKEKAKQDSRPLSLAA